MLTDIFNKTFHKNNSLCQFGSGCLSNFNRDKLRPYKLFAFPASSGVANGGGARRGGGNGHPSGIYIKSGHPVKKCVLKDNRGWWELSFGSNQGVDPGYSCNSNSWPLASTSLTPLPPSYYSRCVHVHVPVIHVIIVFGDWAWPFPAEIWLPPVYLLICLRLLDTNRCFVVRSQSRPDICTCKCRVELHYHGVFVCMCSSHSINC